MYDDQHGDLGRYSSSGPAVISSLSETTRLWGEMPVIARPTPGFAATDTPHPAASTEARQDHPLHIAALYGTILFIRRLETPWPQAESANAEQL